MSNVSTSMQLLKSQTRQRNPARPQHEMAGIMPCFNGSQMPGIMRTESVTVVDLPQAAPSSNDSIPARKCQIRTTVGYDGRHLRLQ
jgi:hypothetical protein